MSDEESNIEDALDEEISEGETLEEETSEDDTSQDYDEGDGSSVADIAYRGIAPVTDEEQELGAFQKLMADKNTVLALGSFTAIALAVGGYVYFTSNKADVLSNPYSVAMEAPAPNLVAGSVPAGQSPLDMLNKRAALAKANQIPVMTTAPQQAQAPLAPAPQAEVVQNVTAPVKQDDSVQKQEILSEIMSIDDEAIATDPEVNSTLLSGTIPDDEKTANAKRTVAERKAAEARKIETERKAALADEQLEAEMAGEEALSEEVVAAEAEKAKKIADEIKAKEIEVAKAVAAAEAFDNEMAYDEAINEETKLDKMAGQNTVVIGGEGASQPVKVNPIDTAEASDAELAIIQNSTILDTLPAPSAVPMDPREKVFAQLANDIDGQTVTDILTQDAGIRPLPNRYVVVKKERSEDDIETKLTSARSALAQSRYVAALELFNNLYQEYPEQPSVLMGRAVSMQKLGQNINALTAYEEVLGADPGNLEALTNMLGILKSQDNQTAVNNLNQLRELYPYNAEITAQLGMMYGMMKDYKNAVKYLEMAEALKPDDLNITYNKAVAYDKMGKSQKAAELYRSIIYKANYEELERTFPIEAIKKRLASIR